MESDCQWLLCLCCLSRKHLMHTGYVPLSKLPRTKFNCIHLNWHSLQKNKKFVKPVEQKVTTNPKLGQNRKVGQLNCVYCNTTFFYRKKHCLSIVWNKGNNKSETSAKSRAKTGGQLKKQIYNYVLIVFTLTLWTDVRNGDICVSVEPSKKSAYYQLRCRNPVFWQDWVKS